MEPSEITNDETSQRPLGKVKVSYQGPVAPHWNIQAVYGEEDPMNAFHRRVHARLLLLPPHDPQFRRNQERVIRDAAREQIAVDWELGEADFFVEHQRQESQTNDHFDQ